ncbi:MAG: right-handed parallel beta-helix repeat-containing protein [Chloroflexota bacterium]
MDQQRFDRAAAALGGAATRRAGLKAAFAALFGGGAARAAIETASAKPGGHDGHGAGQPEAGGIDAERRPCGPKPRDNRCKKHKDCCTKYCRKAKKGSKAKVGRCRCVKPGKKCKNGQKCCGGALCQSKRCTPQPTCGATGGACTEDANCCSGLVCLGGACGPCVTTVCASGCAHTTVNAAYAAAAAGDTIYIGPGTYPTGIFVTKDITLAACPGVTDVNLVVDRQVMGADSYYAILSEDATDTTTLRTVTLRNLALQASASQNDDEALLYSGSSETVSFKVDGCTFTGATTGIWAGVGDHEANNCRFDGCTNPIYIRNNQRTDPMNLTMIGTTIVNSVKTQAYTSYAVWFGPGSTAASGNLIVDNCTITDNGDYNMYFDADVNTLASYTASITNTTMARGGQGFRINGGTLTISGCTIEDNDNSGLQILDSSVTVRDTTIQRNTAQLWGGGISVQAQNANTSLTIAGSTLITANSAPTTDGAGGIMRKQDSAPEVVTISGTTTSNVTGNNNDNCKIWTSGSPTVVDCGTWA